MRRPLVLPAVFVLTATLAACGQPSTSTQVAPPEATRPGMSPVPQIARGWDDDLADLGKDLPNFGGYSYENGHLILYVAGQDTGGALAPASVSDLESRLAQLLSTSENAPSFVTPTGESLRASALPTQTRPVKYPFANLQRWRVALRQAMNGRDVNELYIDASQNQVVVGTPTGTVTPELQRVLDSAQVPSDAYQTIQSNPVPTKTLSNAFTYPLGGIATRYFSDGREECTLGLGVTYNGTSGFLSASHCTTAYGNDPSTNKRSYYQGGATPARLIGTEASDPPNLSTATCTAAGYSSLPCRQVDVAFFSYSVSANRGRIARTTEGIGSTTTLTNPDGSDQFYDVTNVYGRPEVNVILENVGYVGGYKTAKVVSSNTDVAYSNIVILNVVKVYTNTNQAVTCSGDSGSPWYVKTTTGLSFAGIQSGGGNQIAGQNCYYSAFFSPVQAINSAFGNSTTTNAMLYTRP